MERPQGSNRSLVILIVAAAILLACCVGAFWVLQSRFPKTAAAIPPAAASAATAKPEDKSGAAPSQPPAGQPPAASSSDCKDGQRWVAAVYDSARVPVGTREGPTVVEVSWKPGSGYGGIDRAVIVIPRWNNTVNVNLLNTYTVLQTQYCGDYSTVKAYANHHIAGLAKAGKNASGEPDVAEVGVFALVGLNSNQLEVVQAGPKGPSLATVQAHVEVNP